MEWKQGQRGWVEGLIAKTLGKSIRNRFLVQFFLKHSKVKLPEQAFPWNTEAWMGSKIHLASQANNIMHICRAEMRVKWKMLKLNLIIILSWALFFLEHLFSRPRNLHGQIFFNGKLKKQGQFKWYGARCCQVVDG